MNDTEATMLGDEIPSDLRKAFLADREARKEQVRTLREALDETLRWGASMHPYHKLLLTHPLDKLERSAHNIERVGADANGLRVVIRARTTLESTKDAP